MSGDWFIRYPKIYRLGHEKNQGIFERGRVFVEEKMDGANVRWGIFNGEFRFGSRKRDLTDVIDKKDLGQFAKFRDWVMELRDDVSLRDGYIYFGEYMVPHTIQYDWERVPLVLGFDVWDVRNGRWLSYDEKVREFERIGVPVVPLVDVRDVSEISDGYLDEVIPESRYYNGKAEGVVFKNYDVQLFAKLVAEEFKERNEAVFGKGKKRARRDDDFEMYLLEKYVPPRRVEKVIQSLVDEGYRLDMGLMKVLPAQVLKDVVEEEGIEIFRENITVDFRRFRKLISKRCVNVLQRMLAMKSVLEQK